MRYLCINKTSKGDHVCSNHVDAPNAIEALRLASEKARRGGRWTAYQEIITKEVVETVTTTRSYAFKDTTDA